MGEEFEHVILLSTDALRADHLSCYGYNRKTSPNLDEFSEKCIKFTNAYSASSHTREAVPALLTGKYPDEAVDSGYNLASDTIASTLSEEGFATGGFHSNPYVSRAYGFDRGFDKFDDDLYLGQNKFIALAQRALDKLRNRHYARAEEINERSLSWIDSLEEEQSFFLWNHYMDTHGPYEPPEEYATLFCDETISNREAATFYQRAIQDPDSISEDERQLLIDLYDAEVRYNDEKIGEFLDALRSRNLLGDSLLIITSDHGDAFGEHGYYEHPRYLHDEITKVPLMVRSPELSEYSVRTPASTLDIRPTVEDLVSVRSDTAGTTLTELSRDDQRLRFSHARGEKADSSVRRFAVRSANSRCLAEYDLSTDALRFDNGGDYELREVLEEHITERIAKSSASVEAANDEQNKEIKRRLEALGYK